MIRSALDNTIFDKKNLGYLKALLFGGNMFKHSGNVVDVVQGSSHLPRLSWPYNEY